MASLSANAIDNLNQTIGSFKSKVDVKIDSVNNSTSNIQATTDKIYNSISKFKQDMIQNEEKQLAHENILRIEQILKEQYGDHDAIRKTVMGVVKDFDVNLVRNSSIQEISEELWITSSRYWLSYAMMAITAWINNYEEVAANALAECVRRDPAKATLFFCLFNLRFGRNSVAKKWFFEYVKTLNPNEIQQETAILLQAFLNGLFGTDKELENNVHNEIKGWIAELNADPNVSEELTDSYLKYITLLPPANKCEYATLSSTCSNYNQIKQSYADVSKYQKLIEVIDAMDVELEEQTETNYKSRVDAILMNLISNYDDEERELKDQETYFNYVISNDGRMDSANEQYNEYLKVREESFNIGKQMIKWAVYDDASQTDVQVKKFGLRNTKNWFQNAIEKWAQKLQENQPLDFSLTIDDWSCVSNGEDQNIQVENLREHYENNKFQMTYVNTPNILAIIIIVLSIGLVFITPYSLVATLVAGAFLAFNILRAQKAFPERVQKAVDQLNRCMVELADFKQYYGGEKEKKDILKSKIEYL